MLNQDLPFGISWDERDYKNVMFQACRTWNPTLRYLVVYVRFRLEMKD
jgi:hypothetical protein